MEGFPKMPLRIERHYVDEHRMMNNSLNMGVLRTIWPMWWRSLTVWWALITSMQIPLLLLTEQE